MEKLLMNFMKELNKAIDNRNEEERSKECFNGFTYWDGKINAYVDVIVDLADELGIETDINPINGHIYVK